MPSSVDNRGRWLTVQVMKSVQGVSKRSVGKASFAKTDARYWQDVIFRPAYRAADASQREVKQYHVKIQHQGRREFPASHEQQGCCG